MCIGFFSFSEVVQNLILKGFQHMKMSEFRYFITIIWAYHNKCIQMKSTYMPGIGSTSCELGFAILKW